MAAGLYVVSGFAIMPTIDEVKVDNLQYLTSFTAVAGSSVLTTGIPHGQIPDEIVIFTTTGTLPAPLVPFALYRVCTPGLGANTLEVAPNAGWNPPPETPPIVMTDIGTGVHSLWVRPLENLGADPAHGAITGDASTNFITSEDIGIQRAVYFDNNVRFQLSGGSGLSGVTRNTDYWSSSSVHSPTCKWKVTIGGGGGTVVPLGSGGAAALLTYGYPANTIWGLGDLGVIPIGGGAGEQYYSICGDCTFGGGPPGGGGAAGGGGEDPVTIRIPRPTIRVRDPETANLIRRARSAVRAIENMSIVGEGFSGDVEGGFMYNSDVDDE